IAHEAVRMALQEIAAMERLKHMIDKNTGNHLSGARRGRQTSRRIENACIGMVGIHRLQNRRYQHG
ncbi:MAG TPA: hypothetical protein VIY09_03835, partial [Rhizomicrobium sp.]